MSYTSCRIFFLSASWWPLHACLFTSLSLWKCYFQNYHARYRAKV